MVRTQDIRQGFFDTSSAVHVSEDVYLERVNRVEPTLGDLLFSREGTYFGDAAEVPENTKVCLGQRMVLIRPNPELLRSAYLRMQINSPQFQVVIAQRRDGTVAERLNLPAIRNLPVKIPSLEFQDHVVAKLSCLEQKIAVNRQMNATLEAMAQALFKSWFVDFDPVIDNTLAAGNPIPESLQAHAEARAALGDQRKPLPEAIQQQFPSSFVFNDELGWVPEGWAVKPAQELATIGIGKTPPRKERHWFTTEPSGNVVWVSIKDMGSASTFIGDSSEYLTPEAISKFNIKVAPKGSVILSFKLTLGRVAIAQCDLSTNEAIAHFVDPSHDLSKEYVYSYLANFDFGNLGSTSSIATAVNSKLIKAMPFLVPNGGVSLAFSEFSGPWFSRQSDLSDESIVLSRIRDTLLPKLLSGQLRIPDAEAQIADVV